VTKLTAAATTPRVEASLSCECDSMCIAACDLDYADIHKQLNDSRGRLIGISLDISGEILHGSQAQLPTGTGTPGVHATLDVYGHRVPIAPGHLVDPLVSQVLYLERVWL
jgi:hypothetical protein